MSADVNNSTPIPPLTPDQIAQAVYDAGFTDLTTLTTALGIVKAFIQAGFTDPAFFVKYLTRLGLLNKRTELEGQRAAKQVEQQQAVAAASAPYNTQLDALTQQLNQVEEQLANLQLGS